MYRALGFAALAGCLTACGVAETGEPPPRDELYYPLSLAVHPEGRYLYVSNAVFDRRYNAGTLMVYDTFARRILENATVKIGLFAGQMVVARFHTEAECALPPDAEDAVPEALCGVIGYTVTRDDNRLLRLSIDPTAGDAPAHLDCGADNRCANANIVDEFSDGRSMSADPYGVHVDGQGLTTTHVERGVVVRWGFESGTANPVERCTIDLPEGATSVTRHPALGWFYVSDRFGQRITMVEEQTPLARDAAGVTTDERCRLEVRGTLLVDPASNRGRTRGLAFSADGTRLYVASSTDGALRVYDTSVAGNGRPRNRLMKSIPVGSLPDVVRVAGLRPGERRLTDDGLVRGPVDALVDAKGGGLVYVSLFDDDRVAVVDPDTLTVVANIDVSDGPHDIAFMPDEDDALRAYVTDFSAHRLTVIDVEPGSSRRFAALATVP